MMDFESPTLTIEADGILAYAEFTEDYNPIHVDAAFAAETPFGKPIAHGTMSLNMILQAAAAALGNDRIDGARVDARFVRPVFIGDHIHVTAVQADTVDCWDVALVNQHGEAVIKAILSLASK